MPVASHFLAGSILSLVLPVALLLAVMFWWIQLIRRGSGGA